MKFNNINVQIDPSADVGKNVRIGDNTIIYGNVTIGENSTICDNVVLGEPINDYYFNPNYQNPQTIIGANSLIRSKSIIYAGCTIGDNFSSGHCAVIRERSAIGVSCSVGTMSSLQQNVTLGDYTKLHSYVHISEYSTIGNFVFFYPFSVMTNDPYPPSETVTAGSVGDYTQIAVHCVLLPGVRIGVHCLIGANSVVTRRVPDYSFAKGEPAKVISDIRSVKAIGRGKLYPWPDRFSRGMPWQEIGYDNWIKENSITTEP